MTIQAVIFDNDGVLTDSDIVLSQVFTEILKDYGVDRTVKEVSDLISGVNLETVFGLVEKEYSINLADNILEIWDLKAAEFFTTNLKTCDGVFEMLEELNVKKAVATGSTVKKTSMKHKTTGLDKIFKEELIFSGQDTLVNKPAPDVYLKVANCLGVDPENCMAVEDSVSGVKSGKAANMIVLAYLGGSHVFDKEDHRKKLLQAGADLVFDDMRELPKLIEEFNKRG